MSADQFAFEQVVQAWRDARRWDQAHPDLAEHYSSRYRAFAFASAFGVDLEECPRSAPEMPA
jgi:hypothetical protein